MKKVIFSLALSTIVAFGSYAANAVQTSPESAFCKADDGKKKKKSKKECSSESKKDCCAGGAKKSCETKKEEQPK